MLPGSVDKLPLLPLNHLRSHLREVRSQQLERWTPYSCKFILLIIRAQWLFLPGRMCRIMCHTQQLWEKNIVWIESVSSRWPPLQHLSLHHPAVRRLLDSQYIFFPFSLSPPAGEYLEVHKSCSLSLNTNPRGATTGQLLESRVCPSIGIENYKRRHLWCKWHKLENVLSAVANLGISEELKAKLQDVMVARSLLSIGKVLGEGRCITSVTVLIKLF